MTDETDTTSEVARVLDAHRLDTPTWPERRVGYCTCGIQFPNSAEFAEHQAAVLAEAGLLRDQAVIDERDMLKRGGAELGRQIDHYLTWVLDATGMHHLIDEDGDGDWELVWERLAEMGRARKAAEGPQADPECPCAACDPGLILDGKPTGLPSRMNVCPDCGNKRCPKAANHARWQCSGSNAVGQVGVPVETKGATDA